MNIFRMTHVEFDETIRVKLFNEDLIEFNRAEDNTIEYNSYDFVIEE